MQLVAMNDDQHNDVRVFFAMATVQALIRCPRGCFSYNDNKTPEENRWHHSAFSKKS